MQLLETVGSDEGNILKNMTIEAKRQDRLLIFILATGLICIALTVSLSLKNSLDKKHFLASLPTPTLSADENWLNKCITIATHSIDNNPFDPSILSAYLTLDKKIRRDHGQFITFYDSENYSVRKITTSSDLPRGKSGDTLCVSDDPNIK